MLRIHDLAFSYGRRRIVDGLSFEAAPGECVVLAGPNGSGKSTILALVAGVLRAASSEITVDGRIGYVPQGVALFEDATVEENLHFFADLARTAVPASLPFAVETYRKKKVSALSGGMKKQVSIACAMIGDPEVILLDEPCAALDIDFRAEMIELVLAWKREGRTLLYVGHEPAEFFDFYDKIIFLGEPPTTYTRRDWADCSTDEVAFRERYKNLFSNLIRK